MWTKSFNKTCDVALFRAITLSGRICFWLCAKLLASLDEKRCETVRASWPVLRGSRAKRSFGGRQKPLFFSIWFLSFGGRAQTTIFATFVAFRVQGFSPSLSLSLSGYPSLSLSLSLSLTPSLDFPVRFWVHDASKTDHAYEHYF